MTTDEGDLERRWQELHNCYVVQLAELHRACPDMARLGELARHSAELLNALVSPNAGQVEPGPRREHLRSLARRANQLLTRARTMLEERRARLIRMRAGREKTASVARAYHKRRSGPGPRIFDSRI